MREIVPGVLTWAWPSPEKKYDFNGWFVVSGREGVIVDPPPGDDEVIAAIAGRGAPSAVLLTNKDHVRDSERFASHFRVPILIHQADAPLVTIRLGGVFKHGEELPAGLEAIRVPDAKSPGECALLLRRSNAIILGDALIGAPPGRLSFLPPERYADFAKAREGVRTLLNYRFEAVLAGDGEPLPRGGRRAIEDLLARTGS